LVACVSIVTGLVLDHRYTRADDPWRARLVHGQPVQLQFLCGTNTAIDCQASAKITYRRQDSRWCASLQLGEHRAASDENGCNADPERGTISILGVVHTFDRFGVVKIRDRITAKMLPG
jgi:hypothetical protein